MHDINDGGVPLYFVFYRLIPVFSDSVYLNTFRPVNS